MPPRPRHRDQDPRADRPACAGPAWSWARPSSCCAPRCAPGSPPVSSTRSPRTTSARPAATPSFKGYHRLPGVDLRLGQRRGRARHPGRPGARRRRRHLHRLRRDRRRLARRRRDHGRRSARYSPERARADAGHRGGACGAASPPPGSAAGSPTSPTPSRRHVAQPRASYGILEDYVGHGIGSAMHQPPNVPNFGRPGRGPKLVAGPGAGRRADGHARRQGDRRPRGRLDGGHRRRQLGRPLRAHLHAHPDAAPGCSPRSTAARRSSTALGVPFGGS